MSDESHLENNKSEMQDHSTMDHSQGGEHDNHENHHEMIDRLGFLNDFDPHEMTV